MPKCQNDVPADKRTRGWLMVDSPLPTIGYTILYLIMVALGPRLMKNRRPFTLKKTMIAYNLSMCVLNAYIAFEVSFESKPKEHTPHSNSQELSKKKNLLNLVSVDSVDGRLNATEVQLHLPTGDIL